MKTQAFERKIFSKSKPQNTYCLPIKKTRKYQSNLGVKQVVAE